MRIFFLVLLAASLSFSGCSRTKSEHVDAAAQAAAAAESRVGPEEHFARQTLEDLTALIQDNMDDGDRAEDRLGAYLSIHRDEIIENTRALERNLALKEGDERTIYEEVFNDFFGPTTQRWSETLRTFAEANPQSYRRVERLLKNFMNRNTAPNEATPNEADAEVDAP